MTLSLELLEEHRMFGGWQQRYRHAAQSLNCNMTFSIYLPPPRDNPPPVLYWLSGLTCNDENFTLKAGAQRIAAELGLVLVMPDTSPRGDEVPNDEGYDLGQGRRVLPERHPGAVGSPFPHVRLHQRRTAGADRTALQRQRSSVDLRPLDGRPRRADDGVSQSAALPLGIGVRADR